MGLYQKHRPQTFEEIIGNEAVVESISRMLQEKKKMPHAFLFTGGTGCGKTTIARIIAKELGCEGQDYKEIDSADFRGIDTVREMRRQVHYLPIQSDCRVWVIDECHKMTNDAQNALLKILEDTPKHVYFILCTTDPQKLLKTVKGRCSTFQMNPLSDKEMLKLLRRIVIAEEEKIEKDIYYQIIQDAQGHPRNALTVLEQVLNVEPENRLEAAKRKAEEYSEAIELCRALIAKKPWNTISPILQGLKEQDPEGIRRIVLGYAQAVLLKGGNVQAAVVLECFMEPFFNSGFPQLTLACFSVLHSEE